MDEIPGIDADTPVMVEWVDSFGVNQQWDTVNEAKPDEGVVHSVGYIIAATEETILLAPHVARFGDHESYCGAMSIPKAAIRGHLKFRKF